MGIEPRHDSRYVADAIGYSCQLPSKTVQNRIDQREEIGKEKDQLESLVI